ncbi:protein of unknown function (plasmid) [Magnetospirillum sp. XM-1]|nr:protein of unknown function [Magnetospirillum sp. XM-1]
MRPSPRSRSILSWRPRTGSWAPCGPEPAMSYSRPSRESARMACCVAASITPWPATSSTWRSPRFPPRMRRARRNCGWRPNRSRQRLWAGGRSVIPWRWRMAISFDGRQARILVEISVLGGCRNRELLHVERMGNAAGAAHPQTAWRPR